MNPHDHRNRPAIGRHHQIEQQRAESFRTRNNSISVNQPIAAHLDRRRPVERPRFRS
jgi:hypothetical protein